VLAHRLAYFDSTLQFEVQRRTTQNYGERRCGFPPAAHRALRVARTLPTSTAPTGRPRASRRGAVLPSADGRDKTGGV